MWDQRSNYLYRGATRYTLQEGARYFADAHVPPDRDPDAIILVFGDHLPFLGMNFAGYVDSGVLAASSARPAENRHAARVPNPDSPAQAAEYH